MFGSLFKTSVTFTPLPSTAQRTNLLDAIACKSRRRRDKEWTLVRGIDDEVTDTVMENEKGYETVCVWETAFSRPKYFRRYKYD
jgi:hypothetical protein